MKVADVPPPLSLFQGVVADRDGTFRLANSINATMEMSVDEVRFKRSFERWWPEFEVQLNSINNSSTQILLRTEREILEESIELIREIGSYVRSAPGGRGDPRVWIRSLIEQELSHLASQRQSEHVNYVSKNFYTPEPFERMMENREKIIDELKSLLDAYERLYSGI
jgi:predicted nucleotidyltransferase